MRRRWFLHGDGRVCRGDGCPSCKEELEDHQAFEGFCDLLEDLFMVLVVIASTLLLSALVFLWISL